MRIVPSQIAGVEILPLASAEHSAIAPEAVPFSVAVCNRTEHAIALIGVRFDMTGPRAEQYSVVHYADMLREPSKAELKPGGFRAICAEPSFTAGKSDTRGKMNLDNLRRMLGIQASLDCVAFDDGRFEGPDTRGAFARLSASRNAEASLIEETLQSVDAREFLTRVAQNTEEKTIEDKARLALARKLLTSDLTPASHRLRIELWRA